MEDPKWWSLPPIQGSGGWVLKYSVKAWRRTWMGTCTTCCRMKVTCWSAVKCLTPARLSQLSPALSEGNSGSFLEINIIFNILFVQCCIPVPFTARKLSGPSLCCCGSSCEISVNIYRAKQLSVFSYKPDTPSPKRPETPRILCAFLQTVQQLWAFTPHWYLQGSHDP